MKVDAARWRAIDRCAGFTLLEVLVALVIIGVALAAAMRGAMALTNAAEDARLKLLAALTAENRLLELRLARQRLDLGQSVSDCEQGGMTFACEQIIKSTPNPFFRRVELRVFTESDGSRRQLAEMMTVLPTNQ
ncbi:MAG TPA: type II secretion system minor pseudopilin GspI [Burkholderiaceae bacterium]|jgi:general secretion pathway protein I|nr:type II secretion system minor pseudopilin GspI [Burkholderiaceae bacterium]